MWDISDISFELVDEMTDAPVVTLGLGTPVAQLTLIAEPIEMGAALLLRETHIQGATPNAIGIANLKVIALAVMEGMDYDALIVEGAVRSTGANPGRRPRPFRFTRNIRP